MSAENVESTQAAPVLTRPVVPAAPVGNTHPGGVVGWIEDHLHLLPKLDDLARDANKARSFIPKIEAFLPKLVDAAKADPALAEKLGPMFAEATELLSVLGAL